MRLDFETIAARASLTEIVGRVVALRRAGREWTGCCPFHAEKTPSFTLYSDKGGRERFKCFGCGAQGDVVDFVGQYYGVGTAEAVRMITGGEMPARAGAPPAPAPAAADEDREAIERARGTWRGARYAADGIVRAYLRARGIDAGRIGGVPGSLRSCVLPYWAPGPEGVVRMGRFPVMVAPIQGATGAFQGVHLTYLAEGGEGKIQLPAPEPGRYLPAKKVRGKMAGGAIRLGPVTSHLWLAEGIETALSVAQALTRRPVSGSVWTAVALGNFGRAGLPETVRSVTILADNDMRRPDGPGQRDPRGVLMDQARALALRGFAVRIAWAPEGQDFNDVLRGDGAGQHGN